MTEEKRPLAVRVIAVLQQSFGGSTVQFADEADDCGPDDEFEISRQQTEDWRGNRKCREQQARYRVALKRQWRPQRR